MTAMVSWEASPVGANRCSRIQTVVHPLPARVMKRRAKANRLTNTHRRRRPSPFDCSSNRIPPGTVFGFSAAEPQNQVPINKLYHKLDNFWVFV